MKNILRSLPCKKVNFYKMFTVIISLIFQSFVFAQGLDVPEDPPSPPSATEAGTYPEVSCGDVQLNCNLFANGTFESGMGCAMIMNNSLQSLESGFDCVSGVSGTPDRFSATCNSISYQIPTTNSIEFSTSFGVYNTDPNNFHFLGLRGKNGYTESVVASLAVPLVTGNTYNLSMWAIRSTNLNWVAPNISVYGSTSFVNFQDNTFDPAGLDLLYNTSVNTATETWTQLVAPSITASNNYTHLVIVNNNTNGFSYVGVDDFTITQSTNAGTINAIADFQISCGQSVLLNPVVTSCNTNAWTFELFLNGVSQGIQNNPNFDIELLGNYTLNFYISINGLPVLVDSDNFIVTANTLQQCFADGIVWNTNTTLTSGNYTGQDIAVNADITIAGTVIFSNCQFKFATGKKIIIAATGDLKLNTSSLKSCIPCAGMWEGIIVNNGGKLNVTGSTIRDANAAVQTEAVPLNYTGPLVPNIVIKYSVFNKNKCSVWIKSHPKKIGFIFTDNTITCRDLPGGLEYGAFNFSIWIDTYDNFRTNLTGSDTYYPQGTTIQNIRSDIGVRIDDQVFSDPLLLGTIYLNGKRNLIDYQNYGTQITNSNVSIYNNQYQFHLKTNSINSTAIIAPTLGNAGTRTISIGSGIPDDGGANLFVDNYNAIDIDKQQDVFIKRNSLINSTTNSTTIGLNGIFVKNTTKGAIVSGNNPITNFANAIQLSRNTVTPSLNPSIQITNNTINAAATGYCNFAIHVRDVANTINLPAGNSVDANTISNVKNGITISNIKNNITCSRNNITILNTPTPNNVYAIKLETCQGVTASKNTLSANTGGGGAPSNEYLRGLWVFQSAKNTIWCNNIFKTGRGIEFDGACPPTLTATLKANSINNSMAGLVLSNNGVIGQQGSPTEAIQMTYVGSFALGQTRVRNTNNNNTASVIYDFQSNLPTSNQQFLGTAYILGSGLKTANNQPYICPQSNGDGEELVITTQMAEEYGSELAGFIDANDSLIFDNPLQYELDKFVYNQVKDIALLSEVNDTLDTFVDSTVTDPIGRFRKIDDKIAAGLYTQAQTINMNTVPNNVNEVNQKSFNTIYIAKLANQLYEISNSDKDVLSSIAIQCAYLGGNSVIQARNFLMAIEDSLIEFVDSCGTDSSFALPKSSKHSNDECQNYVQNGTFSEYENCPEYAYLSPEDFNAIGFKWKAFGGTPDYFNYCSLNGAYIPYTGAGIQYPMGDSAFVGIVSYVNVPGWEQANLEIVGNELCDQLVDNEYYCTKLFVAKGENDGTSISSFGVYFTDEEFYFDFDDTLEVPIVPQVKNDESNYLSSLDWQSIQGIYYANGGEDIIGVGNFNTPANTDTVWTPIPDSGDPTVYMFLENVSIEKLTAVSGGGNTTINQGQSIQIGADPTEVADYSWTNFLGDTVSTLQYPNVSPDSTTTYIVTKNQCNVLTTDTVTVFVSPTALAEIGAIGYFNLYPNPAKDAVNIYFQSGQEVLFELHDIAGKLIYSQVFPQGKNGYILPLNDYANGIYICNLKTINGQNEQRKLMIAR